jgi:hypothetical protein
MSDVATPITDPWDDQNNWPTLTAQVPLPTCAVCHKELWCRDHAWCFVFGEALPED